MAEHLICNLEVVGSTPTGGFDGRHTTLVPVISSQEHLVIHGLRTAAYPAPNLARGKAWYSQVLGRQPYFDEPFYVGFSVGGFELGLIPDGTPGDAGSQVFWGVPDAAAELGRLVALGARIHEAVNDVGGGIKVASVLDPFGNVFGIIENPHFKIDDAR